jgi:predicted TIM-barrel fold metal-dependent hydrolase
MPGMRSVDGHAHIIDPGRFTFADGPGYRPQAHETGTREAFAEVLDRHGVRHALLVQPSGYGTDNAAMLDAMARRPGRYKGIAVVDAGISERSLEALAAAGVVGVRFNLVSYDPDALARPAAARFLARLKALGWFAQVYADDAQWPAVAPILRRSGVRVLVDHFGVRNVAAGTAQPGFQTVLGLGRDGLAAVKLSAAFRLVRMPDEASALDPFVEALLAAFGVEGCVWGSDWPFLDVDAPPDYAAAQSVIDRWLRDPADRDRVRWRNPVRLFGMQGEGDARAQI